MDSQHRHELNENELAHWLENLIERMKPYGSLIAIGLVGLVLIFTAWGFYQNASTANEAVAWSGYTQALLERAPDLGALETVSTQLDGAGPVADWSSITLADGRLWEASITWLQDRGKATESLTNAREEYERLLLAKRVDKVIQNRARFGLARSYEIEGDVEKAIEEYKQVDAPFADLAKQRIASLGAPEAQESIAWLKTAQAPRMSMPVGPGTPGMEPDFSPDSLDQMLEEAAGDDATSDETLDDILKGYDLQPAEVEAEVEEEAAMEMGEDASDASAEEPAAETTTEEADADAEGDK
jgi:hypothetical protein